jgi:hypothetical protein
MSRMRARWDKEFAECGSDLKRIATFIDDKWTREVAFRLNEEVKALKVLTDEQADKLLQLERYIK